MSLFYANELILRLVSRLDPHPGLFAHYGGTLAALADGEHEAATLRYFERDLLDELGLGLSLDASADDGAPIDREGRYEYVLEHGPRAVGRDRQGGLIFDGCTLLALQDGTLAEPGDLEGAQRLTRAALAQYLGDRPIRTRQVLQSMRSRARR